jgi:hypothetical protein
MREIDDQQDFDNEEIVMRCFIGWMNSLPLSGGNGNGFSYQKIPAIKNVSTPDFRVYWNGLTLGCVEIKCRDKAYPSWMISRKKLVMLHKEWHKRGFQAAVINAVVKDGEVQLLRVARYDEMLANKARWEDTPESHTTTKNHGLESRPPEPHFNIPDDLFRRIK